MFQTKRHHAIKLLHLLSSTSDWQLDPALSDIVRAVLLRVIFSNFCNEKSWLWHRYAKLVSVYDKLLSKPSIFFLLSSIKRECNMSSLWQMRFSILCLTWYCFELMTGTKMYSIKNSEGGKMEKHKVSWFSFGEWCTSFLSVKKCSDASLKSWPPFPRIFHTFWSGFGTLFQNHSKLSRKQSELHFFDTFLCDFQTLYF